MSDEYDDAQAGEEGGMTGPGAPTPLTALEVYDSTRTGQDLRGRGSLA